MANEKLPKSLEIFGEKYTLVPVDDLMLLGRWYIIDISTCTIRYHKPKNDKEYKKIWILLLNCICDNVAAKSRFVYDLLGDTTRRLCFSHSMASILYQIDMKKFITKKLIPKHFVYMGLTVDVKDNGYSSESYGEYRDDDSSIVLFKSRYSTDKLNSTISPDVIASTFLHECGHAICTVLLPDLNNNESFIDLFASSLWSTLKSIKY